MIDWASLILRIGIGLMFFAHGVQMALGKMGGPGVEGFSKMLGGMGFSHPLFWSYLAGYTTLIGGLFLIFGLYTRFTAVPLIIFMLVAVLKVHISKGFFLQNGGYEYNFVILTALIALIVLGGGKFSLTKKF